MKQSRAAVLVGVVAALLSGALGRRKLWELDLSKLAHHQADLAAYVWGISFSPDETKVAIGFDYRWNFDPRPRRVIVVPVDKPQTLLQEFEVSAGSPWPSDSTLVWSPSGSTLVAKTDPTPTMLRLSGGAPCKFPEESRFGGFLTGDRMIVTSRHEIQIRAPDCSLTNSWLLDGSAFMLATSPERDLLAIQRTLKSSNRSVIEVIDASSQEVKHRWTSDTLSTLYGFVFSGDAKRVCSGNWRQGKGADAACWDTQTGTKVAEDETVTLDMPGIAGPGGDLIAMTDYRFVGLQGKFWRILDMEGGHAVPRRRVIWNVRTGEEIASWRDFNRFQQTEQQGRDLESSKEESMPTVLSLSPTGKYLSEGGSGKVSVYAVNP